MTSTTETTEDGDRRVPDGAPLSSVSSLDSLCLGQPDTFSQSLDVSLTEMPSTAALPNQSEASASEQQKPTTNNGSSTVISPSVAAQPVPRSVPVAIPSMMLSSNPLPMMTSSSVVPPPAAPASNSIPEFLFQLTKMLTDDNKEIIEWSNGRIEVHSPHKLESQVLHNYFRHSKFASFQRQLNYFGFRKLAGKGKMAPCSYVNDAAVGDIGSLLHIKRKTTAAPSCRDKGGKRKESCNGKAHASSRKGCKSDSSEQAPAVNPVLANILYRSQTNVNPNVNPIANQIQAPLAPAVTAAALTANRPATAAVATTATAPTANLPNLGAHQALARAAVGRGIRHSCTATAGNLPTSVPRGALPTQTQIATSNTAANTSAITLTVSDQAALTAPAASSTNASSASFTSATAALNAANFNFDATTTAATAEDSLFQLANNYKNSLNELASTSTSEAELTALAESAEPTPLDQLKERSVSPGSSVPFTGFLSRDSSLIDLAMIPTVDDDGKDMSVDYSTTNFGMNFVDFTTNGSQVAATRAAAGTEAATASEALASSVEQQQATFPSVNNNDVAHCEAGSNGTENQSIVG